MSDSNATELIVKALDAIDNILVFMDGAFHPPINMERAELDNAIRELKELIDYGR